MKQGLSLLVLALVTSCGLAACSVERSEHPDACSTNTDCTGGRACYRGFCVLNDGGASTEPPTCAAAASQQTCYGGPSATLGIGECRAGQQFCVDGKLTKCFEEVTPSAETCNGKDDDCNGTIDDIAETSCEMAVATLCGGAGRLVCREGAPLCELASEPQAETCNGKDDDCDGKIDELPSAPCYPADKHGCSIDATGAPTCQGVCAAGMSKCDKGVPSCDGAITEVAEICQTTNETAYDEDCDGQVDEQCVCSGSAMRDCYAGPQDTSLSAGCGLGTQACGSNALWQPCAGQGLPHAETCDNPSKDDDCNGTIDDIVGLGQPCNDPTKLGECRKGTLECRAGTTMPTCIAQPKQPETCDALDQDCDGNPVNGFNLNSDATCGSCDISCSGIEHCCGGTCRSQAQLDQDDKNCGVCGKACGSNSYCCQGECLSLSTSGPIAPKPACNCAQDCGAKSCCGTGCVDLKTDSANCGACGHACIKGVGPMGGDGSCKAGLCQ
jgi:hypothetical protein